MVVSADMVTSDTAALALPETAAATQQSTASHRQPLPAVTNSNTPNEARTTGRDYHGQQSVRQEPLSMPSVTDTPQFLPEVQPLPEVITSNAAYEARTIGRDVHGKQSIRREALLLPAPTDAPQLVRDREPLPGSSLVNATMSLRINTNETELQNTHQLARDDPTSLPSAVDKPVTPISENAMARSAQRSSNK